MAKIAEFYKHYPCKEGTMPEDFSNLIEYDQHTIHFTRTVVFYDPEGDIFTDFRVHCTDGWRWQNENTERFKPLEWFVPEPLNKEAKSEKRKLNSINGMRARKDKCQRTWVALKRFC